MKKNLLLVFVFVSTFGFSQQVLKRITDTPTHTIIEMFALSNGTSLPYTFGNFNIDLGISSGQGTIIIYNPIDNQVYSPSNGSSIMTITSPNISLGNGTFNFSSISEQNFYNFQYNSTSPILNINILQVDGNADALEDSNSFPDLLYTKFHLPKQLDNGNTLPNNLLAILNSRQAEPLGSCPAPSSMRLGFKFNGTTWVSQLVDPNGNAFDVLQEIGTNGQLLSLYNFNIQNYLSIFPNPTNNFITIQNKQNSIENFEYKILDLTGRIVKNGNSKFNELINIESLTSGNYIIQIQTDSNQFITQKLIKN